MSGIQPRGLVPFLMTMALGALAGCLSKPEPSQQLVPGTTNGGSGGTGFMGFPFNEDAGGGSGGSNSPDAPVGGAGGGLTFPRDGGPDALDTGMDLPRDTALSDVPGTAGAIGDKCTTSATCTRGGVCAADVAGGGYCTAECTTSGICPSGSACIGDGPKICVKTCSLSSGCRTEHACLEGFCLPKCTQDSDCDSSNCNRTTGLCGPSRVGSACAGDSDCGASPAFCDRTNPAGYCSLPCGGPMNLACPDDANCFSAGSAGVCLKACAGPSDCRAGFLCAAGSGGVSSCIPRCTRNEDCAPGLRCEVTSGACVEATSARGTLGGACASAADCTAVGAGAFCVTEAQDFPGGYCSLPCENNPCPAAGVCVASTPPEANCLSKCNVPSDCRQGYGCFALRTSPGGVCFPKCTADADCSDATLICDRTSGHCVARPTGPSVMMSGTINLTPNGPVSLSPGVLSDRFSVTVPADAVSVTFVALTVSNPNAMVRVYRMEQTTDDFATATRLYDQASLSNPVRITPPFFPGSAAVLHPNTPSAPFMTSSTTTTVKLAVRLQVSAATTVNVSAIVKTAPSQALTQGTVDLNLFFVGLPELNATLAKTDPRFQQIFETMKAIWARSSLEVGTVNYIDITGADAARFTDLDIEDLGDLVSRSNHASAKDQALNIFFVHTITSPGLGDIFLGISAGIPGVPVRGTTHSGVVVTTADFPMGLAEIGDTWAHEGGHFLGLYHATEEAGTAFDPLPDTPECPRSPYDINNDRVMHPAECRMRGAENIMFWTSVPSIPSGNMSANQSFVLLRNPAVR